MNNNLKAIRYVIDGENAAQWYKRQYRMVVREHLLDVPVQSDREAIDLLFAFWAHIGESFHAFNDRVEREAVYDYPIGKEKLSNADEDGDIPF